MTPDFSVNKTYTAAQIFEILDASDGKDNVIKKDAWNVFAGIAKCNTINTLIKKDRAMATIKKYLNSANTAKKASIFEHVQKLEQGESVEMPAGLKVENTTAKNPSYSHPPKASAMEIEDVPVVTAADAKENKHYTPKMAPAEVKEKYPEVYDMVSKVAQKYNKNADIAYWTELIATACEKYKVDPAAIVSIVGREVRFVKEQKSSTHGSGPMQVTTGTVEDFWPGSWGHEHYWKAADENLLNEILYDENGKLRYKNATELRKACINDHEYGIKVGILIYKEKEAKALWLIDGKKHKTIEYYAEHMSEYKANMTDAELKELQKKTFYHYNASDGAKAYEKDAYNSYLLLR